MRMSSEGSLCQQDCSDHGWDGLEPSTCHFQKLQLMFGDLTSGVLINVAKGGLSQFIGHFQMHSIDQGLYIHDFMHG